MSHKQAVEDSSSHPVLKLLNKQELIQHIEDLQEELRMSRAFTNIAETGGNDAILECQGRNRFLAEKVIPIRLKPIASESLNSDKGEHRIIDGDNLAVMTSLLTDFRGGPTRGFDVIYDRRGSLSGLIDTYTGKKTQDRSPEILVSAGYTHIIWNLTLCEGGMRRWRMSLTLTKRADPGWISCKRSGVLSGSRTRHRSAILI